MPKVYGIEDLYFKKCPRCHKKVYYEEVRGKGWKPVDDAIFDVGDFYVNLVCPYCGWRINTSIQPRNVWRTEEEDEEEEIDE